VEVTVGGDPDALPPWYFTPQRAPFSPTQSYQDTSQFRERLQVIDPRLDVSWHPLRGRWQLWIKDENIRSEWCAGWRRMMLIEHDGVFCPLDERVFWAIYATNVDKWGGAKVYFDRVEHERELEARKVEEAFEDETSKWADDWWDHKRPQVGYGHSNGSKVATHDFGD
jgi:hypothetical protein